MWLQMESRNPAGTGKDRAVQYMLRRAMSHARYRPGVPIVEGTSGSTGIALALQCRALGLPVHLVLPDDQAAEKRQLLEKLGAHVSVVQCCSISNGNHYVHAARRLADDLGGIFINQFENKANFRAHYETTGPELWHQLQSLVSESSERALGRPPLDAFVMGAGTGGTIAGVSRFLKERCAQMNAEKRRRGGSGDDARVRIVLADPVGSSLLQKVRYGVCYTAQQAERQLRRHRYDSIVEGVGLDRVTQNFEEALIDDAYCVSDQQILDMAHWLLRHEGLFVGSSSAMNVAVAVRTAAQLRAMDGAHKAAPVVATIVCDDGYRHLSRFWNAEYITKYNLSWPADAADMPPADGGRDPLIQSLLTTDD